MFSLQSTPPGRGEAGRTRCCDRHGAARARAPDDARGAPDGELRQRAKEGLDLIPLAPKTEMDLGAAWRLSRLIKQLKPDIVHAHDPHGVAMAGAGAVDEHSARQAAAGGVAARRLPPGGQHALALEVPAGRLLHLRLGSDPADADRRRRARRATVTVHEGIDLERVERRRRQSCTRSCSSRTARRSSATSRRWCRTRDSGTSSRRRRSSSVRCPTRAS